MNRLLRKLANASPAKAWDLLRDPAGIAGKLRAPADSSNFEAVSALLSGVTKQDVERLRVELLQHHELTAALEQGMVRERRRRVRWTGWNDFLYILIRTYRPKLMIETGVFDGQSSALILQALADNGQGELISVDFPALCTVEGSTDRMAESTLPPGKGPGWLIPDALRDRHTLQLGDARELLPPLLEQHKPIDVFFHDSLHTFEHQMFEYQVAWPVLRKGGLLLSDDIFWSDAFSRFCREQGTRFVCVNGFGATRKP